MGQTRCFWNSDLKRSMRKVKPHTQSAQRAVIKKQGTVPNRRGAFTRRRSRYTMTRNRQVIKPNACASHILRRARAPNSLHGPDARSSMNSNWVHWPLKDLRLTGESEWPRCRTTAYLATQTLIQPQRGPLGCTVRLSELSESNDPLSCSDPGRRRIGVFLR